MQTSEDRVERALLSLAADRRSTQSDDENQESQSAEWDVLAAPEWPGVPAKSMLLSPSRCRALWKQFASDTNFTVQQVIPFGCHRLAVAPDQLWSAAKYAVDTLMLSLMLTNSLVYHACWLADSPAIHPIALFGASVQKQYPIKVRLFPYS